MSSNAVMFSWKRSLPGREKLSAQHFQDFMQYLGGLQKQGALESFEPVLLSPSGEGINGFFLLRGESGKLGEMVASKEWMTHVTRAMFHLEAPAVVRGFAGEMVMEQMDMWQRHIPE